MPGACEDSVLTSSGPNSPNIMNSEQKINEGGIKESTKTNGTLEATVTNNKAMVNGNTVTDDTNHKEDKPGIFVIVFCWFLERSIAEFLIYFMGRLLSLMKNRGN